MRPDTRKAFLFCLTVALVSMAFVGPVVADQRDEVNKDLRVKVIKCQNDDCTEMVESLAGGENAEIIVGDDSSQEIVVRKVHCQGEECEEHEGRHNMVFVGGHGDVKVLAGDEGYAWVSHLGGLGGGYLGVGLTELTPELREHFGVPAGAGVMVSKVMDDSPAFRAGVEVGDILAEVDGESVSSGAELAKRIRGHAEGDEVVLSVWRDGTARSITAALEERAGAFHLGDLEHFGDAKGLRKIMIHCDSDDEDCQPDIHIAGLDDFDCGGAEECEVRVVCKDGGCDCSINGVDADCEGIPGVPGE